MVCSFLDFFCRACFSGQDDFGLRRRATRYQCPELRPDELKKMRAKALNVRYTTNKSYQGTTELIFLFAHSHLKNLFRIASSFLYIELYNLSNKSWGKPKESTYLNNLLIPTKQVRGVGNNRILPPRPP